MESHLLQMRGLKQIKRRLQNRRYQSHLLQMRGLKQCTYGIYKNRWCRIFYRCVD